MNEDINRLQILEEFLKNIFRLSDEAYQQRVWVQAAGPECNDIDDSVCDFFDDGDPILENYKEFGITEIQFEILMNLHQKLRIFTDSYGVYYPDKSTEKLIKMPEWREIRNLAKEVLNAFNFHK